MLQKRYTNAINTQRSWSLETYKNATDAMYKNAIQSLVIERSLSLFSSKRLRLEVLRVVNYLQTNAFLIL